MPDLPRSIGLLLLPEYSQLSCAAVTEPLFVANWLSGQELYRWRLISLDGKPVGSSSGQKLPVDAGIDEVNKLDLLLVLASFDVKRLAADQALKSSLRRVARHGAIIAGVETGSEVIAAAGLLDGLSVSVHWDNLQAFAESHPRCRAVSELYTAERNRLTCAGQSATLDMMLDWIARDQSESLAAEVAAHLMLPGWRSGEEAQPAPGAMTRTGIDPKLGRAVSIMEQNIEEPLPCPAIAQRAGLSMRQMQRLFAKGLGVRPARHYQLLRLARAHALLQQTQLSVTEIAVSTGFTSLEHFCRIYRREFNCRPGGDRRQSVAAPVFRRLAR